MASECHAILPPSRGGGHDGDKAPSGFGLEVSVKQAATHPEFVWWNGERRPWDECTIHVTELGWSTIGAVFEGIRAYTADNDQLYIFRLREHLERLERSMRLVRFTLDYDLDQLTDATTDLLRAND